MSKEIDPDRCGLATILKYVPEDRREEVVAYVNHLCDNGEAYCADIDPSFLGFICDYINYADLLLRKVDTHNADPFRKKKGPITVYDVGCATALQHLVFDPRIHYVGIDIGNSPPPKFFRENCTYVNGRLPKIVEQLSVDPQSAIGIANMSLFYCGSPEDWEVFDRTFKRKFVL